MLNKKIYKKDFLKYKYEYNREKFIENKEYYETKNIFSFNYKFEFIKDLIKTNYKKDANFDEENFKKFLIMNADLQKKKIEQFIKYKQNELKFTKDENLTETEKHLKYFGAESDIKNYYKNDIEYLKSDIRKKMNEMFFIEYEEFKKIINDEGEIKTHYNDIEHFAYEEF